VVLETVLEVVRKAAAVVCNEISRVAPVRVQLLEYLYRYRNSTDVVGKRRFFFLTILKHPFCLNSLPLAVRPEAGQFPVLLLLLS
jgi:hypothetical protein